MFEVRLDPGLPDLEAEGRDGSRAVTLLGCGGIISWFPSNPTSSRTCCILFAILHYNPDCSTSRFFFWLLSHHSSSVRRAFLDRSLAQGVALQSYFWGICMPGCGW